LTSRISTSFAICFKMLAKRLTAIIKPSASGINSKGLPTINVLGDEVALEAYWRILEMAEAGSGKEEIVAHVITVTDADGAGAAIRVRALVDNVIENQRLSTASGTILGVKHSRASVATGLHSKARKSTVLQKARRVTTHFSSSEPTLPTPVSPQREEEKLVIEALRLAAERDAIAKAMPDNAVRRRATATVEEQLRRSLQNHQAMDDYFASDDAQTRIELARQNLN
jgi:hypothetical protein